MFRIRMALTNHDSEEVRAYLESTKGWQDMLSSVVKYLRVAGLHNVNAGNTRTLPWEAVQDWLNQDFVKSWSARNGLDEENRFLSLVRTLAPEFYDNAHAYQHGANNSDACLVPQTQKMEKIWTCVVPQFTDYVAVFPRHPCPQLPLRVRWSGAQQIRTTFGTGPLRLNVCSMSRYDPPYSCRRPSINCNRSARGGRCPILATLRLA